MKNYFKLFICILIPLLAGGISGFITAENIPGWYATLNKPSFNPPNYLFGPVWTILYFLMGLSLFIVLKNSNKEQTKSVIIIFALQLTLNFFWSIIFFNFKLLGLALAEIMFMWIIILYMIVKFYSIHKLAGLLQIPYLLWVSFATALNSAIWQLN